MFSIIHFQKLIFNYSSNILIFIILKAPHLNESFTFFLIVHQFDFNNLLKELPFLFFRILILPISSPLIYALSIITVKLMTLKVIRLVLQLNFYLK